MMRIYYPTTPSALLAQALERPVGQIYAKAGSMGLAKSAEFQSSDASGRLVRGGRRGMDTRFKKGIVPWNKGTPFVAGGNSATTRFKPGQIGTRWVPIGSERINADGYRDRKVQDTGKCNVDWKAVHRLEWEHVHGPIPAGHVVAFKDGNKLNADIGNLELRTRQQHMQLNTIARFPPELRSAMHLVAKVERKVRERTKG